MLGKSGTWSIRPEKITVIPADQTPGPGRHAVRGTVREVVYVGMSTRFVVDLEVGGTLMAVQQNSEMSTDLGHMRGEPVLLTWDTRHEYKVAD